MKKIVAILLVVASLFTLSSSVLSCGAEENSKTSKFESTSDLITTVDKEITREEKIEKFLSEKKSYFPKDKISEIKSILYNLNDNELRIVLDLNFDDPDSKLFTAILGGDVGLSKSDTYISIAKFISTYGPLCFCMSLFNKKIYRITEALIKGTPYVLTTGNELCIASENTIKKCNLAANTINPMDECNKDIVWDEFKNFNIKKWMALITFWCGGFFLRLYDIITVPGRTRQANYEYLLKIVGQK